HKEQTRLVEGGCQGSRDLMLANASGVGRFTADRRLRRNLEGWAFASPWIVGVVLFTVGPMAASAVMAFTQWALLSAPSFVGLDNFRKALAGDPLVWHSLKVTTLYALIAVPLNIVLGLGLALLLNSGISGLRVYRTAYFLPSVLSGVAVALLWRWVF